MWINSFKFVFAILLISAYSKLSEAVVTSPQEWSSYWAQYGYLYDGVKEATAQYNYNYHKNLINNHNYYYVRGSKSFFLRENQFSAMRFKEFAALFPRVNHAQDLYASPPPLVGLAPDSWDPASQGFNFRVEDQGIKCNSGWAYATAKAVEIMNACQTSVFAPASLSGQNLIDCAGQGMGCANQEPQAAFEYLAVRGQRLYLATDYLNNKTQVDQGFCVPPRNTALSWVNLEAYSRINNGNDYLLRQYVGNNYPVVVEFNPSSFEFMHYGGGIFQQAATQTGSHFMPVIGYGREGNVDYWLVQNSFGQSWGENGRMRIARTVAKPIALSAIFPI